MAYEALEMIQAENDLQPTLITMGGEQGWSRPETLRKIKHFGYVGEEEQQARIYAAADAFLCTTLADGQPQTALESLACGTPVIAFDIGPMPEMVIHGKTGYIAGSPSAKNLKLTIMNFLKDNKHHNKLRENCRRKALKEFDINIQTNKYIELYEGLL